MMFKIKVFETDFKVHVDDEGTITRVYSSDDISELLSVMAERAVETAAREAFESYQRELAAEAKAEMLADARRVEE